nr:ATP-binding protein [Sphingomonas sp. NFR15]
MRAIVCRSCDVVDFAFHATYADAILDRLLHNAHRIELTGDSLRRAKPTAAG